MLRGILKQVTNEIYSILYIERDIFTYCHIARSGQILYNGKEVEKQRVHM